MPLTHHRVHLLRTMGWTDAYAARIWRVTRDAVRDARTGITWKQHETPPDTKPRSNGGRTPGIKARPARVRRSYF